MNAPGEPLSSVRLERTINLHSKVRASAVVTVSDPARGEQAIAIVEPQPREQITCRELFAFLRSRLPAAQVVDRIILVVELPRTRDGHPDRHRLRNMYSAAAPPAYRAAPGRK